MSVRCRCSSIASSELVSTASRQSAIVTDLRGSMKEIDIKIYVGNSNRPKTLININNKTLVDNSNTTDPDFRSEL